MTIRSVKFETLFVFFFALACERIFIKTQSIESRCDIEPENKLFAVMSVHFQPGDFTDWDSEGVKQKKLKQKWQNLFFFSLSLFSQLNSELLCVQLHSSEAFATKHEVRVHELCVLNSPYGLCGRKATLNLARGTRSPGEFLVLRFSRMQIAYTSQLPVEI